MPHSDRLHLRLHVAEGVLDKGQQAVRGLEKQPPAAQLQPPLLPGPAAEPPRYRPIGRAVVVAAGAVRPVTPASRTQGRIKVRAVILLGV